MRLTAAGYRRRRFATDCRFCRPTDFCLDFSSTRRGNLTRSAAHNAAEVLHLPSRLNANAPGPVALVRTVSLSPRAVPGIIFVCFIAHGVETCADWKRTELRRPCGAPLAAVLVVPILT